MRRGADGIDHAEPRSVITSIDILRRDRDRDSSVSPDACRARSRTDLLPGPASIPRAEDELVRSSRAPGRQAKRPQAATTSCGSDRSGPARGRSPAGRRWHVQRLIAPPRARYRRACCASLGIGIGHDRVTLARQAGRLPVAEAQHAESRDHVLDADAHRSPAARRRGGTGSRLLRRDVVDLRRRLVVPRAPRRRAVHAHHRALVAGEHHAIRVLGIHPDLVVVVAAWRTLPRHKRLSGVFRAVRRRVDHIRLIRVHRIDRH